MLFIEAINSKITKPKKIHSGINRSEKNKQKFALEKSAIFSILLTGILYSNPAYESLTLRLLQQTQSSEKHADETRSDYNKHKKVNQLLTIFPFFVRYRPH